MLILKDIPGDVTEGEGVTWTKGLGYTFLNPNEHHLFTGTLINGLFAKEFTLFRAYTLPNWILKGSLLSKYPF